MVYAFLMTKGGQQVPQAKSKAKARGAPDVSPPRPPPERPPDVFVRGETLEPSTARPKVRISRKSRLGDAEETIVAPCARMTIFTPTWTQLHEVFFFFE